MPRKKSQPKGSDGNGNQETPGTDSVKTPAETDSIVNQLLSDERIAQKAYALWESRGRPFGSPDVDWYRAVHELYASEGSNLQK